MNLKFIIDRGYDFQMCLSMLQGDDWEYRAQRMGIDITVVKEIHKSKNNPPNEILQKLAGVINKEYEKVLPFMQETKNLYQKSWDEIIDNFSKTVEKLTCPWQYEEYICVVTNYHEGISNWNGNVIERWWKENPYRQRRITAHEVLVAHYFSVQRKYFPNSGLSDEQIWKLAEIAAFALTGLEEKLKKFWPWEISGYYTNHNYPQLVALQEKLKDPFVKRKSFQEYIEKGIRLVKLH